MLLAQKKHKNSITEAQNPSVVAFQPSLDVLDQKCVRSDQHQESEQSTAANLI